MAQPRRNMVRRDVGQDLLLVVREIGECSVDLGQGDVGDVVGDLLGQYPTTTHLNDGTRVTVRAIVARLPADHARPAADVPRARSVPVRPSPAPLAPAITDDRPLSP